MCAAAAVLLSACSVGSVDVTGSAPASSAAAGLSAGAAAPAPASADPRTDPDARERAVRSVLAERAAAFVTADLRRARVTQVPGAVVPTTARIVRLPLASWAYDITAAAENAGLLEVRATLTWRFEGESSGSELDLRIGLRWSGGRWLVASERSVADSVPPWELGALSVVRGERSIVIAVGAAASRARAAARLVDDAVLGVSEVYGQDWQQRVVLVLTGTDEQMAEGLGASVAHVRQFGAVTTSVGSVRSATAPADRVWTRVSVWDRLPDRFRLVLLRHEITHVATRATFSASMPLWLEEGYANYVGYSGSGVPTKQALADLIAVVRRSGVPTALPADSAFSGERLGMAYAGGQLACDLIAESWGVDGLRRVYRLTATGDGTPARNLERALREVTGRGLAGLTADWRARATALAA